MRKAVGAGPQRAVPLPLIRWGQEIPHSGIRHDMPLSEQNASLLSSCGPGPCILGGRTCARPLKKKPYSKIRCTSFHGSSAAISETWRDTSLKCKISCLWRSLMDLARWMSVRYLRPAASNTLIKWSLA